MQRFNELTIFNPTIPTWDCVSLRVHRTSQKVPRKDLQKEMNEEFELITVTISLAATAMNQNSCRTVTGKPAFSAVMQSMSSHVILPSAFGKAGRNKSHNGSWEEIIPRRALKHLWNKISSGLFHFCPRLRAKVPLPPRTWWAGVFREFVISPSPQTFDLNNVTLNFLIFPSLYLQTGINDTYLGLK